jgi:ABC-2 type transport system ATP-binding protein
MTELVVENLHKKYGQFPAVNNVSFSAEKGDIVAILGPNGAGKTTIIKMLAGLLKPTAGTIYYKGIKFNGYQKEIKKTIGLVPQENNIDRDLSVYQNLLIHSMLYGITPKYYKKIIFEALTFAEIFDEKDKLANHLSGGLKRRLVIARAMLHRPSVLYLDEPSISLDPHSRRHIWNFIRKINAEAKTTIFITTHYIEEAELLANNVIIMDKGCIIASGSPDNLKKHLGNYTIEIFHQDEIKQKFFQDRNSAVKFAMTINNSYKIRELTLEDVYINITGRKLN